MLQNFHEEIVMKEIEIKVPHDSSYINRVTNVTDEAGVKFYLTTSEKFDLIVTRLDIFATSAEDSPSDERNFGYEVNEEQRSILFTLDIPQALDLLEAYGVIEEDSKMKILAQAGFKTPSPVDILDQTFEENSAPVVAVQKPLKQTRWGCSNNMYKTEGSNGQQKKSSLNGRFSDESAFKFKNGGATTTRK